MSFPSFWDVVEETSKKQFVFQVEFISKQHMHVKDAN